MNFFLLPLRLIMRPQRLVCRIPELCRVRTCPVSCTSSWLIFMCMTLTCPHKNYQLVISEFALQNPPGGQNDQSAHFSTYIPPFLTRFSRVAFFQEALPFLDSSSYVELYFPFVATSPSLFSANDPKGAAYVGTGSCLYNDDGSLSAIGNLIV